MRRAKTGIFYERLLCRHYPDYVRYPPQRSRVSRFFPCPGCTACNKPFCCTSCVPGVPSAAEVVEERDYLVPLVTQHLALSRL
jgi:hypothetical protein